MKRVPRRRVRPVVSAAWTVALALTAATGCLRDRGARGPVPLPPAGTATGQREFADTEDLLHSIERGTFAERAGLDLANPPAGVTVHFERGTALPEGARPKLRDLVERLRAHPSWRVSLLGCSDPSGPAALNRRLSTARAKSVAAALRELGVPGDRVGKAVGRGEDCEVKERAVHVEVEAARARTAAASPERSGGGPPASRPPATGPS